MPTSWKIGSFGRRVSTTEAEDTVPSTDDDITALECRSKRSSGAVSIQVAAVAGLVAYVVTESVAVSLGVTVVMAVGFRRLF